MKVCNNTSYFSCGSILYHVSQVRSADVSESIGKTYIQILLFTELKQRRNQMHSWK